MSKETRFNNITVIRVSVLCALLFTGTTHCLAASVSFEDEVSIKRSQQINLEKIPQGRQVKLEEGETLFILTKEGIPVILTSPLSKSSNVSIASPHLKYLMEEQIRPALESSTNEIVRELRKAENLIQKKDLHQAQTLIVALKEKYPRISSVLFMSGTIHYLLNNKTTAMEDLARGLEQDPNYEPAKKLLLQLKGGAA
jgi:hypothetical protein